MIGMIGHKNISDLWKIYFEIECLEDIFGINI